MNKPLSYTEYIKGNFKKVLSLLIAIMFSICLIGSIQMFLENSVDFFEKSFTQYYYFTFVDTNGELIDEDIKENEYVDRVIRTKIDYASFQGLGVNISVDIMSMSREEILYISQILDIKIDDLPINDTNQVVMDKNIILNNDFKIGESVKQNHLDMVLYDEFDSRFFIGFKPTSAEKLIKSENDENNHKLGYIIVSKEKKLKEMNAYLHQVLPSDYEISDIDYSYAITDSVVDDVETLYNIITLIVLISIGIGLGISTYVHYFQRRKEFGVLISLGYGPRKILNRINKEILISSVLGFIIGYLVLILEQLFINRLILDPEGIPRFEISYKLLSRVIVIPLFASVFSLIPTWILLNKIDSVSIIEGEI